MAEGDRPLSCVCSEKWQKETDLFLVCSEKWQKETDLFLVLLPTVDLAGAYKKTDLSFLVCSEKWQKETDLFLVRIGGGIFRTVACRCALDPRTSRGRDSPMA
jgi:uncharacterized protein YihD (DUF1040 family)